MVEKLLTIDVFLLLAFLFTTTGAYLQVVKFENSILVKMLMKKDRISASELRVFLAFIVSSYVIIYLLNKDRLTTELLVSYLMIWAVDRGHSRYIDSKSKQNNPKS